MSILRREFLWHARKAYNVVPAILKHGTIWGVKMGVLFSPSNRHLSIFITVLNLYIASKIKFLLLIWVWDMACQKVCI